MLTPARAMAMTSKPGTRPNFPALKADAAVFLRHVADEGGVYGIGMKIDLKPPHNVMRVSNLKDPNGNSEKTRRPCNSSVHRVLRFCLPFLSVHRFQVPIMPSRLETP